MKYLISAILVLFTILFSPLMVLAVDDYRPDELPLLVGDFDVSYDVLDEAGSSIEGAISGIATVRVKRPDSLYDGTYTLTLYIDRGYVAKKSRVKLPYDFRWNFGGLSSGYHELFFIIKDGYGRIGVLTFNITVQN